MFALSTTTLSFTSIRAEGCGLQIVCVIWKQTGVHDVTLACFSVIAKLCAFPFLTFLFLFVQRTFPVHVTSIVRQCQAPKRRSALLCCMEVWTIMYHPYSDTMSPHWALSLALTSRCVPAHLDQSTLRETITTLMAHVVFPVQCDGLIPIAGLRPPWKL